MLAIVEMVVLVVLIVLLVLLTRRAWRARRAWVRWSGTILAGLLVVAGVVAVVMASIGFYRLNARYPNRASDIKVAGTPDQIARGQKLAWTCMGCHSTTGEAPPTGRPFIEGGPMFATLYAPNLTPLHLKDWSDGEIIRAIREGINRDGRSLLIMPSAGFHGMSDDEVQAIVAYLRSLPETAPNTPTRQINIMGAIAFGMAPIYSAQPPIIGAVAAPERTAGPEYGRYLVSTSACADCHGKNLNGGEVGGGAPPGPSLLGIPNTWSEADFIKTMRTGILPAGTPLGAEMPWRQISTATTDDDLRAIYAYIKELATTN